ATGAVEIAAGTGAVWVDLRRFDAREIDRCGIGPISRKNAARRYETVVVGRDDIGTVGNREGDRPWRCSLYRVLEGEWIGPLEKPVTVMTCWREVEREQGVRAGEAAVDVAVLDRDTGVRIGRGSRLVDIHKRTGIFWIDTVRRNEERTAGV